MSSPEGICERLVNPQFQGGSPIVLAPLHQLLAKILHRWVLLLFCGHFLFSLVLGLKIQMTVSIYPCYKIVKAGYVRSNMSVHPGIILHKFCSIPPSLSPFLDL